MANFGLRDMPVERDTALKALHERINKYRNAPQDDSGSNLYWISEGPRPWRRVFLRVDASLSGEPVAGAFGCRADHPDGELFSYRVRCRWGVTILDENGHTLISLTGPESKIKGDPRWMQERSLVWLYGRVPGAGAEEKSATLIAKHRVFGAG